MKRTFKHIVNFVSHPIIGLKFLGVKLGKGFKKVGYFFKSKFAPVKEINIDNLKEVDEDIMEEYNEEVEDYKESDDLLDVLSDYFSSPLCKISDEDKNIYAKVLTEMVNENPKLYKDILDFLNETRYSAITLDLMDEFVASLEEKNIKEEYEEESIDEEKTSKKEENSEIEDFENYNGKKSNEESKGLSFDKNYYSEDEMAEMEGKKSSNKIEIKFDEDAEVKDFDELVGSKNEKSEKSLDIFADLDKEIDSIKEKSVSSKENINDIIQVEGSDELKGIKINKKEEKEEKTEVKSKESLDKAVSKLPIEDQDFISKAYGKETFEEEVNRITTAEEVEEQIKKLNERLRKQKNKLVDKKIEYTISKDDSLEEKIAKINRKIAKIELKLQVLELKLNLIKKSSVTLEEEKETKVNTIVNKDDEIRMEIAKSLFGTGDRFEINAKVNGFEYPFVGIENINPLDIRFQLDDCNVDKFYELKSKIGKNVQTELSEENSIDSLRKEIAELLIGKSNRFEINAKVNNLVAPYEDIENVNPYEINYQMEDRDVEKFYELKAQIETLKSKKTLSM